MTRRVAYFIVGWTVVLIGIAMIVLPGPAIVVIPTGIAILSVEFGWACRLRHRIHERGGRLAKWVKSHAHMPSRAH